MKFFQRATETLARRTTRRGLFGRGAQTAMGALLGAAAGEFARPRFVSAGIETVCDMPGPPCPCDNCNSGGVCQKPCMFLVLYASGCWVTNGVTCCDCLCPDVVGRGCGCTTDWHNINCP
jgi:hypothetical protein